MALINKLNALGDLVREKTGKHTRIETILVEEVVPAVETVRIPDPYPTKTSGAYQTFTMNGASKIEVGLIPSAGTGMVALEEDGIAVFKIAGIYEGHQQVLKVVTTENGIQKTQTFDISELTLETE